MQALTGKVAVIRGGNSGIGLAGAKRFVAEGALVFITGRQQAKLDKVLGSNQKRSRRAGLNRSQYLPIACVLSAHYVP